MSIIAVDPRVILDLSLYDELEEYDCEVELEGKLKGMVKAGLTLTFGMNFFGVALLLSSPVLCPCSPGSGPGGWGGRGGKGGTGGSGGSCVGNAGVFGEEEEEEEVGGEGTRRGGWDERGGREGIDDDKALDKAPLWPEVRVSPVCLSPPVFPPSTPSTPSTPPSSVLPTS